MVETDDGPIVFVDTAGMRRKGKIDDGTEYYSIVRALQAVDDADVALLVIDATEGVTDQDQRLAERIDAAGCPIVVVLNKWELLDDAERRLEVRAEVQRKLHFVGDAPDAEDLGAHRQGRAQAAPAAPGRRSTQYHRRVPTRDVNEVIAAAQQAQPAPHGARVLYAIQGATDPPTFTLFANRELPPHLPALPRAHASARRSTSGDTPSSCASASARSTSMPWCEDCAKYWTPSAMNDDGTCPTCGRVVEAPRWRARSRAERST